jgi:TRAP-type C4-dicarboxylate transport system permease small subunit
MTALKAAEYATRPAARERDALLDAAGRRVEGILELAGAEVRLIAVSSLAMLLLVILAGAAAIIAWVLVVATVLQAAVSAGLPYSLTALVLALGHVVIAVYCWKRMMRLSRHLTMPALRGALHRPKGAS